jgi:hypothetical protein
LLYDAVYLYVMIVDEIVSEGGDYTDGSLIFSKSLGKQFVGKW